MAAALHHVQVAIPAGREDEARCFYAGVLGLRERPKPDVLSGRGGLWFETGTIALHLGVEAEFRPARKAHVAVAVEDLDAARMACKRAGFPTDDDVPFEGLARFFTRDPFGNRTEIIAAH